MHASVIFFVRWVEVGHQVTDVFIFVKEKEYKPYKEQSCHITSP